MNFNRRKNTFYIRYTYSFHESTAKLFLRVIVEAVEKNTKRFFSFSSFFENKENSQKEMTFYRFSRQKFEQISKACSHNPKDTR